MAAVGRPEISQFDSKASSVRKIEGTLAESEKVAPAAAATSCCKTSILTAVL